MANEEMKTLEEWENIYNFRVICTWGFDMKHTNLYDKKMTLEEFKNSVIRSTILWLNSVIVEVDKV
jgi:hypothetical protein